MDITLQPAAGGRGERLRDRNRLYVPPLVGHAPGQRLRRGEWVLQPDGLGTRELARLIQGSPHDLFKIVRSFWRTRRRASNPRRSGGRGRPSVGREVRGRSGPCRSVLKINCLAATARPPRSLSPRGNAHEGFRRADPGHRAAHQHHRNDRGVPIAAEGPLWLARRPKSGLDRGGVWTCVSASLQHPCPWGLCGPSCDPPSVGGRAPRARGNEESVVIDFMAESVLMT
jgi:hypothetical protein